MVIKGMCIIALVSLLFLGCASVDTKLWVTVPGQPTQVVETKDTANLYDSLTDRTVIKVGDVEVRHQMKLGGTSLGTKTVVSALAGFVGTAVSALIGVIF